MAWIEQINEDRAEGLLQRIYKSAIDRAGRVFNILRIQSLNPRALQPGMALYTAVMRGESPLTRAQREMMAVVVSRANDCHY
jgi:alkylhydroperoxidase family enzyme